MLRIVKDNNPSLRERCAEVNAPLSKEDETLLYQMLDYLKSSQDPEYRKIHPKVREGVGLAAPQVGVNKRMLVIYYPADAEGKEFVKHGLVNPKIVANSIKKCYLRSGEGCLSVDEEHPGYSYRDFKITVKAYDGFLKQDVLFKAFGFDAIVLQHEIDHLDGILFYDRIDKKNPYKQIPGSVAI